MNQVDVNAGKFTDGQSIHKLLGSGRGLTFDNVIILPAFNPGVSSETICLRTQLARDFWLNLPLVSSPMDTVTEWEVAAIMALHGGIGVIHMNLPVASQVKQVRRVKRLQMGIVRDPECCRPDDPISRVYDTKRRAGFSTLLVTEDGTPGTRLLGMITGGHAALAKDVSRPVRDEWIPRDLLVTLPEEKVKNLEEARHALKQNPHAPKLPIVRRDGSVAGLVTRKDVMKMQEHPLALVNANGQLKVGAAVSTHSNDVQRVHDLIDAGVDVLLIDSSQGSSVYAVERIRQIRAMNADIPIIAGNVVTSAQAEPLVQAGATGLRVGMGSGSICTTQEKTGVGRPQLAAVYSVARFGKDLAVPVIADGGVRASDDIAKALTAGASTVMVGRLVAGCTETPAEEIEVGGRRWKRYRGMGSRDALLAGGALRYGQNLNIDQLVEQGVSGLVPVEGSLSRLLPRVLAAIGKFLENVGCDSIATLHRHADAGSIRMEERSSEAIREGRPHDIQF